MIRDVVAAAGLILMVSLSAIRAVMGDWDAATYWLIASWFVLWMRKP